MSEERSFFSESTKIILAFSAGFLSWQKYKSAGWAVVHALLGWIYLSYYLGVYLNE